MRRTENSENVCKCNMGSFCKINILVSFISAPECGPTPRNLLGSDVTKDWGFVKTKTNKEELFDVPGVGEKTT